MRATRAVAELQEAQCRREFFDGQRILEEFYKRHLHSTGLAKEMIFVYLCAKEAAARTSVAKFTEALFAVLGVHAAESAT